MEKRIKKPYRSVREVTDEERIGMVKEIFTTVTARYDFLNHFLSFRRDVAWRRFTAKRMSFPLTGRYLDVATGTGDLIIEVARRHKDILALGIDFVKDMLDVGQAKAAKRGLSKRIQLMQGDALALPFRDASFDVAGMAFGIRNIPDKAQALREMVRVVTPGGRIMVLEMSFTRNWFSALMYRTYLNRMLPRIARRFSLNPGAYAYLADSIMNFPSPREFLSLMAGAGMVELETRKLTFGATYLYTGMKRAEAET
jgi:demethylmenaquinone methyltransferase/2-methoxy-6-polyprenyl-1,4-benzoquinol methylase